MLTNRINKWLSRHTPLKSSGGTNKTSISLSTDIGQLRSQNQDKIACLKVGTTITGTFPFIAVALSDGMGGMKDGGECASRAIAAFFNSLVKYCDESPEDRLYLATKDADAAVSAFAKGYGGATLSAVLITPHMGCYSLNIGDSRIYGISKKNPASLERLTIDDSLAEAVGGQNRDLLQFVGMGSTISPHTKKIDDHIEKIIITSDGIHFISHQTLESIISNTSDTTQITSRLTAIARWSGSPDNASIASISIDNTQLLLGEQQDYSIEIWDAFSDVHFIPSIVKTSSESLRLPEESVNPEKTNTLKPTENSNPNNAQASLSTTTDATNSNNTIFDEKPAPPVTPPVKRRSKRRTTKTAKPKLAKKDLQIVIDMDIPDKEIGK